MFENEIAINQFQLGYLKKIAADIPEDRWFESFAGHGHSPAWIVGHLAAVGQLGIKFSGGEMTHPQWMPIFGPGSPGDVTADESLSKDILLRELEQAYGTFQMLASQLPADNAAQPHSIELFKNSPIQSVGNAIALLLTNHFAFHLSQLSSCRREMGQAFLF